MVDAKPGKEVALTDMGKTVCTADLHMLGVMGIQKDMLARTKMVVWGVKISMLTVVGQ